MTERTLLWLSYWMVSLWLVGGIVGLVSTFIQDYSEPWSVRAIFSLAIVFGCLMVRKMRRDRKPHPPATDAGRK